MDSIRVAGASSALGEDQAAVEVEFSLAFGADNVLAGQQAVFDWVLCDDGLAFGAAWAG
jgi:hypothetical protein